MRLSTRLLASVAVLSLWLHPASADKHVIPAERLSVRADRVNVRVGPSRDAEVLTTLRRGDTVEVRGAEAGGWTRIGVPSQVPVWVYGPLVDVPAKKVKAKEANLRSGPGKNYSELGRLKQGDALAVIRESDGWVQIEPPSSVSAYISSGFLEASRESGLVAEPAKVDGVLPAEPPVVSAESGTTTAVAKPAPVSVESLSPRSGKSDVPAVSRSESVERSVVETTQVVEATSTTPVSVPATIPVPASPTPAPMPAVSVAEGVQPLLRYNETVRTVVRVGKVALSLEPQSPSYFHLDSVRKGEGSLGFLTTTDESIRFATFRGKVVRVVAKEFQTRGTPAKTLLQVESIGLEPGY